MLVRKQILVPAALDKKILRLAQRGASLKARSSSRRWGRYLTPQARSTTSHLSSASSKADRPGFRSLSMTFTADAWFGGARPANHVGATGVIPIAEAASAIRLS